ncbi:hypothetical protein BKA70DRAFT_1443454 [Coprinopsis sp. MPI-PUGE-AT-0042]|nr:hypothetical protein BKA70DRAFT_1443454 [Coprinopsis sp. MPI-PUGE-AT-0042]
MPGSKHSTGIMAIAIEYHTSNDTNQVSTGTALRQVDVEHQDPIAPETRKFPVITTLQAELDERRLVNGKHVHRNTTDIGETSIHHLHVGRQRRLVDLDALYFMCPRPMGVNLFCFQHPQDNRRSFRILETSTIAMYQLPEPHFRTSPKPNSLQFPISPLLPTRSLAATLILASRSLQDKYYLNRAWANFSVSPAKVADASERSATLSIGAFGTVKPPCIPSKPLS